MRLLGFLILFLLSVFDSTSGLKILAVIPAPATSHFNIGSSIANSLVRAGHELTVIQPYKSKKTIPNRRDIFVDVEKELKKYMAEDMDMFEFGKAGPVIQTFGIYQFTSLMTEITLSDEKVQQLMHSNEKFDLVIYEVFGMDAFVGFGQHFNCPVIGYTTFGATKWHHMIMKNPEQLSYVPDPFSSFTANMNFQERFYNALYGIGEFLVDNLFHKRYQRSIYKQYFPKSKSTFDDDLKTVSLIFSNDHFSQSSIKPYLPNIVEISGVHVEKPSPLPEEWKTYLDNAKEGVIYFSMGSSVKSKDWPKEKREALVKALGKVNMQILWKYENDTLPDKPDNIKIGKWFPQRDILAHPNVKLFITHGGLLGTTESIVAGKPVLGIPIFGDQKMNIARAIEAGYGSKINLDDMSPENIFNAIDEMIKNPKYFETAQKISRIFNDRPLTPQESVVYWTEYIARHQGAPHLKSPGLQLSFIEFHMIDVYAVFILIVIVMLYIDFKILKFIIGKFFSSSKNNKLKKN